MFKKSIKFISIPTILLTPSFLYYQKYNKNDDKNKKNKYSLDEIAKHNTKTDISYNTQPQESRSIWNLRGIFNNSWHKVVFKPDKMKQD